MEDTRKNEIAWLLHIVGGVEPDSKFTVTLYQKMSRVRMQMLKIKETEEQVRASAKEIAEILNKEEASLSAEEIYEFLMLLTEESLKSPTVSLHKRSSGL